mmetsp:Transcript_3288/g.5459  ORF Transcript_3288/g.5459 Transcript_3288/m.5459 type:complete len:139 (+) Transcript_3288:1312-1728(+)
MDWDPYTTQLASFDKMKFSLNCYGMGTATISENTQFSGKYHQVLERIFRAKALSEPDEFIQVSDMAKKRAPKIKRYQCGKAPEGYNFVLIVNDEREATYKEYLEYNTFEGLRMIPPPQGNSKEMVIEEQKYEVVVQPG